MTKKEKMLQPVQQTKLINSDVLQRVAQGVHQAMLAHTRDHVNMDQVSAYLHESLDQEFAYKIVNVIERELVSIIANLPDMNLPEYLIVELVERAIEEFTGLFSGKIEDLVYQGDLDDAVERLEDAIADVETTAANALSIAITNLRSDLELAISQGDTATLTAANTHADTIVGNLDTTLRGHISTVAGQTLTSANAHTDQKIAALINDAPETLDTLGEIAAAIQENQTVVDLLNAAIGTKANADEVAQSFAEVNTAITTVDGRVTTEAGRLDGRIDGLNTTINNNDQTLRGLITANTTLIGTEGNRLTGLINAAEGRSEAAIDVVAGNLTAEINRATAREDEIDTRLTSVNNAQNLARETLETTLRGEITAAAQDERVHTNTTAAAIRGEISDLEDDLTEAIESAETKAINTAEAFTRDWAYNKTETSARIDAHIGAIRGVTTANALQIVHGPGAAAPVLAEFEVAGQTEIDAIINSL